MGHKEQKRTTWLVKKGSTVINGKIRVARIVSRLAVGYMMKAKPNGYGIFPLRKDNATWCIELGGLSASNAKRHLRVEWKRTNVSYTERYARYIYQRVRRESVSQVAQDEG